MHGTGLLNAWQDIEYLPQHIDELPLRSTYKSLLQENMCDLTILDLISCTWYFK